MKNRRKKNLIKKISNFFLLGLIIVVTFLGNVKNVYAASLLRVNFPKGAVVEHLKLDVPKKFKRAWLKAEEGSWERWLNEQYGFLGRQLFWDPAVEQATLLIGWESRSLWKNISQSEIELVQKDFEKIARSETGLISGNPFPLIYEGELNPE